jgi:hypothetical protein
MNRPITKSEVKRLPKGFTATGIYPNRRQRRARRNNLIQLVDKVFNYEKN